MAIIQGHAMQSSSRGFYPKTLEGSLRFNDDDSAYLQLEPTGDTGGRTKYTYSTWVKRCNLGTESVLFSCESQNNVLGSYISINSSDKIELYHRTYAASGQGALNSYYTYSPVLRDPSAWYHIVVSMDSSRTDVTDIIRLYINGTLITAKDSIDNPTTGLSQYFGSEHTHYIGRKYTGVGTLDAYIAETFFIDGTEYAPTAFAETKNGVWVPKNVTSTDFTMGTNGFHLPMTDDTEVEAFNTVLYRGNDGTQSITGAGFTPDFVWVKNRTGSLSHMLYDSVRGANLSLETNNTNTESSAYFTFDSFDNDGFTVNKASSSRTNASSNDYVAWCWDAGANNTITGHSSVTYTGNSGTQTIKGLPFTPDLVWIKNRDRDIAHGIFDTVRGFGVSGGTNTAIGTNRADAEGNGNGNVTGVVPNGFMLAPGSSGTVPHTLTNQNGEDFVAWCWDAGDSNPATNSEGGTDCTLKSNGDFSIFTWDGTGSATTIGHGLDGTPDFFIVYNRGNSSENWVCWHNGLDSATTSYIKLDLTEGQTTSANVWGSTAPTATTIGVGTASATNGTEASPTENMVCYAWRDVTGKQKFGTYEGNNTATGPTVNLGFRPGFVMIKNADGTGNWNIFDGSRFPFADNDLFLRANLSNTEVDGSAEGGDAYEVEFTSTGFIPKASGASSRSQVNGSATYIYAAFKGSYSDYITDVNTEGTVDSRVKASNTTGFSIVSWIGDGTTNGTFGHGLSSAPDMIVAKDLDSNSVNNNWHIWHTGLSGATYNFGSFGASNESDVSTATSYGGIGDPSATTIKAVSGTVDSRTMNESGDRYIAYCWTETTGVSKFGTYTGNGTTNAITTGFKPGLVMIKRKEGTRHWYMFDDTRFVPQPMTTGLFPGLNLGDTTDASYSITFTDTGFTLNSNNLGVNTSGGNFVYAAFADTREAAFWLDQSSNDNDWQPVNLDHNDTLLDSPTDNFCTLNSLNSSAYLEDGNLVLNVNTAAWNGALGTFAIPKTGKWYWEVTYVSGSFVYSGLAHGQSDVTANTGYDEFENYSYGSNQTSVRYGTTTISTESPPTSAVGDVWGWYVNDGAVYLYKNGTLIASPTSWTANMSAVDYDYFPQVFCYSAKAKVNFGQEPWAYGPPA